MKLKYSSEHPLIRKYKIGIPFYMKSSTCWLCIWLRFYLVYIYETFPFKGILFESIFSFISSPSLYMATEWRHKQRKPCVYPTTIELFSKFHVLRMPLDQWCAPMATIDVVLVAVLRSLFSTSYTPSAQHVYIIHLRLRLYIAMYNLYTEPTTSTTANTCHPCPSVHAIEKRSIAGYDDSLIPAQCIVSCR